MQNLSIFSSDDWEVCEGTIDGARHIIRMRATLPAEADQQLFDQLIIVRWLYESDESGMPDNDTHRLIVDFEDALDSGTEKNGVAFQVLSLTGAGKREWRYYTTNANQFIESLNSDLRGHPAYPLEIESFHDPEWTGLREFHDLR